MTTLLETLGSPVPPELPGHSLLCAIETADSSTSVDCRSSRVRPLFASVHHHSHHWVGVTLDRWKLVLRGPNRIDRRAQLYDLERDPLELDDVAERHPVRVGYLATLIRSELGQRPDGRESEKIDLDDATAERLRALGYLD